jgi:Raf kinase inhibitor-like YbhB/YbcL family protein
MTLLEIFMKRILGLMLFLVSLHAHSLTVISSAASENGPLPVNYTCDGTDTSPAVSWSGAPSNTVSFALTLVDPDAPGGLFYHWVLFNIPKNLSSLPEGLPTPPPNGMIAGANSWGKIGYRGPCPPKGASHHYVFTLYALDSNLTLAPAASIDDVIEAMKGHVIAQDTYIVVYSRWRG